MFSFIVSVKYKKNEKKEMRMPSATILHGALKGPCYKAISLHVSYTYSNNSQRYA